MRISNDFWSRVSKAGPADCWPWTGKPTRGGYGRVNTGRIKGITQNKLAHRLAYELANGRPPVGVVRHTCDNPPCCNPAHLLDGTQQDNVADAVARGRIARRHSLPHAVLTDADHAAIRASTDRGVDLAAAYGVSQQTISGVRHGRQ